MSNKFYTRGEEIINSITHGVGALLAAAALALVVVFAANNGDALRIISAIIYGTSLIVLYVMSTLYHAITNNKAKMVFRIFDHCSIFILIAGTYTPYAIVAMRGVLGWIVFATVWFIAIVGIVLNSINLRKYRVFSMICYLGMGWSTLMIIKPLVENLSIGGIYLIVAGGLSYSLGTVFYINKKYKYMHSIWHLFVLAGSTLHFFSILFYVY